MGVLSYYKSMGV